MQKQLIWFRQDLRIHDHAALWHARQSGTVIALVVLSPQQWQKHDDAPIKIDFYLRQIEVLQHALTKLNIPLIIQTIPLWENIATEVTQLCQKLNIENIHANIECGVNELNRDFDVQKRLNKNGHDLILYHDRTLFPVGSIRNKSNQPYQVFGAFKKYCYEQLSISVPQCYPAPEVQSLDMSIYKDDLNPLPTTIQKSARSWRCVDRKKLPKTQWGKVRRKAHAWHLLDEFLDNHIENYQVHRDFPNLEATSQLSAYLNIGIISIRQCLNALFRAQHGQFTIENIGQQTWMDELLWREFYQHILFDFPRVSKHLPFKQTTQNSIADAPKGSRSAWQMESRQAHPDWEQWFMQHLIDGDLAANNGGWQWCASTGTDSVPYFRIFNPVSQSQKFDAEGEYIRKWVPELADLDAKTIHEPYAKNSEIQLNYPQPIVDLKQSRIRAIEAFKQI
ncbi:hypothetical protein FQR65_LT18725 [Abscondita terminalis]|nr:hypothetical protein FQR65_LT18725 [Abscondita terminalis]